MKKLLTALCLVVMTGLVITSCNSKGGGDAYTLKMRLNKGDKFAQNMQMDMTTSVTMAGMSKDVKMKMNVGADFEVMDSAATGKQLKITYTDMQMKMDMGMPSAGDMMDSIMNEQRKAIVGKSIVVTIAGNKITDVSGMENIMNDSVNPNVKAAMDKVFSKDQLNSMFGMMLNLYPEKPVKVGDTWNAENTMDLSGMKMTVKNTYKLLGVKDGVAEIGVDGTIDTQGTMAQGGMEMKMDMKGTQKGSMNAGVADGYIKNGQYDMDVTANMDVMGQKVPMKLKATTKINK